MANVLGPLFPGAFALQEAGGLKACLPVHSARAGSTRVSERPTAGVGGKAVGAALVGWLVAQLSGAGLRQVGEDGGHGHVRRGSSLEDGFAPL